MSRKFEYVVFSFFFISQCFLFSLVISSLRPCWLITTNFWIFQYYFCYWFLISSLCLEKRLQMISISFLIYWGLTCDPPRGSIPEAVLCALEKNVYMMLLSTVFYICLSDLVSVSGLTSLFPYLSSMWLYLYYWE